MSKRIGEHLRSNVVGYVAIFLFAVGGTAYATHPGGVNTISSTDIINGEVESVDVGNGTIQGVDIATAAVNTSDIANDSISASKIVSGAVRSDEIADGSITVADTSGLVPYGDVLWAVVNADGNVVRDSNGITASILEAAGTGDYEVDFSNVNLDHCASIAQISDSGVGFDELPGQAATAQGEFEEFSIDVRTFDSAGAAADRAFTVHVLCPEGEAEPTAKSANRGRR
jgi:hypothetical protein